MSAIADRIDGHPQSTETDDTVLCQVSMHVLGLKKDYNNDNLVVSRGTRCTTTKSLTQSLILILVSKIFDPIVLVASFTVGTRVFLKDIWLVTLQQWDDDLPQGMLKRFLVWVAGLLSLENIKIPKKNFSGTFDIIELHIFGENFKDVFSAVAFLRVQVTPPTG